MGFEVSIDKPSIQRTSVNVKGMTCDTCVRKIESNVLSYPAVKSIRVSLENRLAKIIYDSNQATIEEICTIISHLGFISDPVPLNVHNEAFVRIDVEGMTCNSCVHTIQDLVGQKPGVGKITVSLADKTASIWYNPCRINPNELKETIYDMGFGATVAEVVDNNDASQYVALDVQSLSSTEWSPEDEDQLFYSEGVLSVQSSSNPAHLVVFYLPNLTSVNDLMNIVQSMGFICKELSGDALKDLPVMQEPSPKVITNGIEKSKFW